MASDRPCKFTRDTYDRLMIALLEAQHAAAEDAHAGGTEDRAIDAAALSALCVFTSSMALKIMGRSGILALDDPLWEKPPGFLDSPLSREIAAGAMLQLGRFLTMYLDIDHEDLAPGVEH